MYSLKFFTFTPAFLRPPSPSLWGVGLLFVLTISLKACGSFWSLGSSHNSWGSAINGLQRWIKLTSVLFSKDHHHPPPAIQIWTGSSSFTVTRVCKSAAAIADKCSSLAMDHDHRFEVGMTQKRRSRSRQDWIGGIQEEEKGSRSESMGRWLLLYAKEEERNEIKAWKQPPR